jgi:hypothetical protein
MVDEVNKVMRKLTALTTQVVKKLTLDTTANLIATTPVDTGWARANWLASVFKPEAGPEQNLSKEATEAAEPGLKSQQEQLLATIAISYKLSQGPVFITNNVPYIKSLNNGSSLKAPVGFVQAAITKALRIDLGVILR